MYNHVHNIWEFDRVLVQFLFTTSKRDIDISYQNLYIRVTSKTAKRLST